MARLPRLAVGGIVHLVLLRALPGLVAVADDEDRAAFVGALRDAAGAERVAVHAYALLPGSVWLLLTPADGVALGRFMQAVGRRYVIAHNRRYARTGTLWAGRYRAAVIEPGPPQRHALMFVDLAVPEPGATSASHRLGGPRSAFLSDPPAYWTLGNTPFERESAYRALLARGLDADVQARLAHCAAGGWAFGSAEFAAATSQATGRPALPRPRGRPRRLRA